MTITSILWLVAIAILGYAIGRRCLGTLATRMVKGKNFQAKFRSIGFGGIKGLQIRLSQGPIALIEIECISIGRKRKSQKEEDSDSEERQRSWLSFLLSVKGVQIHLSQKANKTHPQNRVRKKSKGPFLGKSVITSWLGHLGFALLPSTPLLVENITISYQDSGLSMKLKYIDFAVHSLALFSSIRATLIIAPTSAEFQRQSDGTKIVEHVPILGLSKTQMTTELHWLGSSPKLESTKVEFGRLNLSLSLPLLLALAQIKPRKAQRPKYVKKDSSGLDVLKIAKFWPQKMLIFFPEVKLEAISLGTQKEKIESALSLQSLRLQGTEVIQDSSRNNASYKFLLGFSSFKAQAGILSMKPAGQISCPGMSTEARIYSPAETQHHFSDSSSGNPSLRGRESSDVSNSSRVAVSGAFRAWDTKICPEDFWHSVAVFQSIQDFIESQTLKMEVEAQSIQNGTKGLERAASLTNIAAQEIAPLTPGNFKESYPKSGRDSSIISEGNMQREEDENQNIDGGASTSKRASQSEWLDESPDFIKTHNWDFDESASASRSPGQTEEGEVSTSGRKQPYFPLTLDFRIDLHKDSQLDIVSKNGPSLVTCKLAKACLYASGMSPDLGSKKIQSFRAGFELLKSTVQLHGSSDRIEAWTLGSLKKLETTFQYDTRLTASRHKGSCVVDQLALKMCESKLTLLSRLLSCSLKPQHISFKGKRKRPEQPGKAHRKQLFPDFDVQILDTEASYITHVDVPEDFLKEGRESMMVQSEQNLQIKKVSCTASDNLQIGKASVEVVKFRNFSRLTSYEQSQKECKILDLHSFSALFTARNANLMEDTAYREYNLEKHSLNLTLEGLKGEAGADPILNILKVVQDFQNFRAVFIDKKLKEIANEEIEENIPESPSIPVQKTRTGTNLLKLAETCDVSLKTKDLEIAFRVSDQILWGASVEEIQILCPEQNCIVGGIKFMLNRSGLICIKDAKLCLHTPDHPGIWPERVSKQEDRQIGTVLSKKSLDSPVHRQLFRQDTANSQGSVPAVLDSHQFRDMSTSGSKSLNSKKSALDQAYERAGLSSWVDGSEIGQQKLALQNQPEKPLATLECCVWDVQIILPFSEDPGTAQRYTELWAKAIQEAIQHQFPKRPKESQDSHQRNNKETNLLGEKPLEVRLAIRGAMFRMDHHPLEAWLAVKGPILRGMSTEANLWDSVRDASNPSKLQSYQASAAMPSLNPSISIRSEKQIPHASSISFERKNGLDLREATNLEVYNSYKSRTAQASVDQNKGTQGGALMHVEVDFADVVIVICSRSKRSTHLALDEIAELDPPSKGVPMRQVQKLHFDAKLGNSACYFSGCSKPMAALKKLSLYGSLVLGRQITAPPLQTLREISVGSYRSVNIPFSQKGSRALIKIYTNMKVEAESPRVWYGMGLEPVIGLVGQSGKRLSPSDPDKSKPKPVTLPWFDMLRFVWRGNVDVQARNFEFALAVTKEVNMNTSVQRMQATIPNVSISWRDGIMRLDAENLSATGFLAGGLEEPAGFLHALPLVDFPQMNLAFQYEWLLPHGRKASDHHLFPVPVPEGYQKPISFVNLYQAYGVNLNIDVFLGNKGSPGWTPALSSLKRSIEDLILDEEDPHDLPLVYVGGHQVAFMRLMVERLQCPPLYNKMVNRRGTFFQRADPRRPPIKPMPKLINRMDVALKAPALEVVTYTVNLEEAASGIAVTLPDLNFSLAVLLNLPNPRPILPGYSAYSIKREEMYLRSAVLQTTVESSDVVLRWRESEDEDKIHYQESQELLSRIQDAGSQSVAHASSRTLKMLRNLMSGTSTSETFIASISHLKIHEDRPDPTVSGKESNEQERRPLMISMTDFKLLIDVETRNAAWSAASHIIGAFKLPRKFRPFAPSFVHTSQGLSSKPSLGSLGRRESLRKHRSREGQEMTSSVPELLTTLLDQNSDKEPVKSDEEEADSPENLQESPGGISGIEDSDEEPSSPVDPEIAQAEDNKVREQLRDAQKEVKEKAWHDVEKLWAKGEQKWNLELNGLQICLQASEQAGGRFLLVMEKAELCGRRLEEAALDTIFLDVRKVQALVSKTSVDPGSPAAWLNYQQAGFHMQSSPSQNPLKEVFTPFSMKLWNSKLVHNSNGSIAGKHSHGEELHLTVPFINVTMDSKEFTIMVDVINNVGLAQPPEVSPVNNDVLLLEDAFNEELDAACETYAASRQNVFDLMAEAQALASILGMRLQKEASDGKRLYQSMSLTSGSVLNVDLQDSQRSVNLAFLMDEVKDTADALQQYLSHRYGASLQVPMEQGIGLQLLLRWSHEQIQGARLALDSTAKALRDLRKNADKLKQGRHEKRFLLELDGVTWSLCQGRKPFAELALATVVMDNIRYKDKSGTTKLLVQHLEIKDVTGSLGETPGTPMGALLVPWKPNDGWKKDALFVVTASVGTPTQTHTVYRHLEVVVHPLGINLTENVAKGFWEYFFPKEDVLALERQEKWAKQSKSKMKSGRKNSVNPYNPELEGPSPPSSVFAPGRLSHDQGGNHPTSTHTSPGTTQTFAPKDAHRRIRSESARIVEPNVCEAERQASAEQALNSIPQQEWLQTYLAKQGKIQGPSIGVEVGRKSLHRRNPSLESSGNPASPSRVLSQDPQLGSGRKQRKKDKRSQARTNVRNVRFEHVRINRVHCRATYQGKPKNFSDFKLVLDNRVYKLDGSWRILFQRMKWDVIRSVLKSVLGLQGKKFREIFPESVGADGEPREKKTSGQGFKNMMVKLGKGLAGTSDSTKKHSTGQIMERAKERLLLGSQHPRALTTHPHEFVSQQSSMSQLDSHRNPIGTTHSFSQMLNQPSQEITESENSQHSTHQQDSKQTQDVRDSLDSSIVPAFSWGTDIRDTNSASFNWGKDVQEQANPVQPRIGRLSNESSGLNLNDLMMDRDTASEQISQQYQPSSDPFYNIPEFKREKGTKAKAAKFFGKAQKALNKAGVHLQNQAQVVKKYVEDDFAKAALLRDQHAERLRIQRLQQAQQNLSAHNPNLTSGGNIPSAGNARVPGGIGSYLQSSFSQKSTRKLKPALSHETQSSQPTHQNPPVPINTSLSDPTQSQEARPREYGSDLASSLGLDISTPSDVQQQQQIHRQEQTGMGGESHVQNSAAEQSEARPVNRGNKEPGVENPNFSGSTERVEAPLNETQRDSAFGNPFEIQSSSDDQHKINPQPQQEDTSFTEKASLVSTPSGNPFAPGGLYSQLSKTNSETQ